MPTDLWPVSDSVKLHLPVGRNESIGLLLQDGSGASLAISGATYTAIVYTRLGRTQAASGAVTVESWATGEITIDFLTAQTSLLSERKHYYWELRDTVADVMVLDGPVYPHLPGNWPQHPYRGRVVRSRFSSLT